MKKPDRKDRSDSNSAFSSRSGNDARSGSGGGGKSRPYGTRPSGGDGEGRGPRKPYGTRGAAGEGGGQREGNRSERPFRPREDRPDYGQDRGGQGEGSQSPRKPRPQTPYQRRAAAEGGNAPREDREFRKRDEDRPRRDTPDREEGGKRPFRDGQRPDGERKPRFESRNDRPQRREEGDAGSDRPSRRSDSREGYQRPDGDRKPRFEPRGDRPQRREGGETGARPYRKPGEVTGDRRNEARDENRGGYRGRDNREGAPRGNREGRPSFRPRTERPARRREYEEDEDGMDVEMPKAPSGPMTLNKYVAHSGISGRREAGAIVKAGRVTVNGVVNDNPAYRVQEGDVVTYDGRTITPQTAKVYVLLNKPKGFITTTEDDADRRTVMELVQGVEAERLYPIGRLDRATTGVLLLTNDGDLAQKLTHPKYEAKKIYQVTLDKDVTKADFERLVTGVALEDGEARADQAAYLESKKEIGLEIHSGRNRIVRRMFEAMGYTVEKLDRVMFAGLTKKNVPRGQWRLLTDKEVVLLKHFKAG